MCQHLFWVDFVLELLLFQGRANTPHGLTNKFLWFLTTFFVGWQHCAHVSTCLQNISKWKCLIKSKSPLYLIRPTSQITKKGVCFWNGSVHQISRYSNLHCINKSLPADTEVPAVEQVGGCPWVEVAKWQLQIHHLHGGLNCFVRVSAWPIIIETYTHRNCIG